MTASKGVEGFRRASLGSDDWTSGSLWLGGAPDLQDSNKNDSVDTCLDPFYCMGAKPKVADGHFRRLLPLLVGPGCAMGSTAGPLDVMLGQDLDMEVPVDVLGSTTRLQAAGGYVPRQGGTTWWLFRPPEVGACSTLTSTSLSCSPRMDVRLQRATLDQAAAPGSQLHQALHCCSPSGSRPLFRLLEPAWGPTWSTRAMLP